MAVGLKSLQLGMKPVMSRVPTDPGLPSVRLGTNPLMSCVPAVLPSGVVGKDRTLRLCHQRQGASVGPISTIIVLRCIFKSTSDPFCVHGGSSGDAAKTMERCGG